MEIVRRCDRSNATAYDLSIRVVYRTDSPRQIQPDVPLTIVQECTGCVAIKTTLTFYNFLSDDDSSAAIVKPNAAAAG